jgi:hypothetical protein
MSHRLLKRPRDKGLMRISFFFLHSCHDHRGQCVAIGCHHELPARACGRYILLRRSVGTKRCSSPLKITVFSPAGSTPVRPARQDSERQGCRCACVSDGLLAERERVLAETRCQQNQAQRTCVALTCLRCWLRRACRLGIRHGKSQTCHPRAGCSRMPAVVNERNSGA